MSNQKKSSDSFIRIAIAAVVIHFIVNAVHGAAHGGVEVWLPMWKNAVVFLMIILAPPAGLVLIWRGKPSAGYGLLTASMAGSLAFGVWHHFVAMSSDHVSQIPEGAWGLVFIASSWALAVSEIAGTAIGIIGLRRN